MESNKLDAKPYQIIIGLALVLVGCSGFFGFLVIRLIRGYDESIKDLYDKIDKLPEICKDLEWIRKIIDRREGE
jgi:hypothetical protein